MSNFESNSSASIPTQLELVLGEKTLPDPTPSSLSARDLDLMDLQELLETSHWEEIDYKVAMGVLKSLLGSVLKKMASDKNIKPKTLEAAIKIHQAFTHFGQRKQLFR